LVGEAGKEAIVGPHGTAIVDKPTVLALGTEGTEAVVPLHPDGSMKIGPSAPKLNRPDRNMNPGNIKHGPESEQYGAIGYDEQNHAIFPTWEAGFAAQGALLARKYAGKSIEEIGGHGHGYAEDPRWAAGVADLRL
jgi:hypothetical protein